MATPVPQKEVVMALRAGLVVLWLIWAAASAAELPRVASINLCTDQLVVRLAEPEQIQTVSWLAADPEESMLAAKARALPLNYGSAEEILRHAPDVVIGGSLTSPYTRGLLRSLDVEVVEIEPASSIDDIARNLRRVGAAIGQADRGERAIAAMRERARAIAARRPAAPVPAVVLRPGGFTVGAGTLADELMQLAGLVNVAAENGLDRWGSLSVESLIRSRPDLLIYTGYRRDQASLANAVLAHPAVVTAAGGLVTAEVPARYWACGLPESLESAEIVQRALADR